MFPTGSAWPPLLAGGQRLMVRTSTWDQHLEKGRGHD